MASPNRLMAILAHPDDESMALGGTLVKYAAAGVETSLVMATRGEQGWFGEPAANPGPERLGQIREAELRKAATYLGIRHLSFLGYSDGELADANPDEAVRRIATEIRRQQPQVVVTFGPEGLYGHPDHVAISQLATSAVIAATDPGYITFGGLPPHRVEKLYYRVFTSEESAHYRFAFGEVAMTVGDTKRSLTSWPDWSVTTRLNTTTFWPNVWAAVDCHRTQITNREVLETMGWRKHRQLWGVQHFYRATGNGTLSAGIERDLFDNVHSLTPVETVAGLARAA